MIGLFAAAGIQETGVRAYGFIRVGGFSLFFAFRVQRFWDVADLYLKLP